jgi:F1F0 ATPase subunit 2
MDAPAMTAAALGIAFVAGAGLGAAHFFSLWWSVVLIRDGRAALGVAIQSLRFAALGAALVFIAKLGPGTFVAAAAGVITARMLLMRRARRFA